MPTLELSVRHDWTERFEGRRGELAMAFGSAALGFDHIGSTSVPGLLAKPIIDVLVTLRPPAPPATVVSAMERLGYEYRGEYGVADRHFFAAEGCHVHAFRRGEGEWTTHLMFRDFLRASELGRRTYTRFKLATAEAVGWDRAAYQRAKDRYVTEFLPEAVAWAERSGWRPPHPA